MKRVILFLIFCLLVQNNLYAQKSVFTSPYSTSWVDGAIVAGSVGLNYWGLSLMKEKKGLSEAEIKIIDADMAAAKAKIPAFDRWSAGSYSLKAKKLSDIPFYASFGVPLLFLANSQTRQNAPQIGLLYLETMAITGAIFSQANGRVNRIRPSIYNQSAGDDVRMDEKGQNAFYGGHTTATAAASFFAAKIFNDYYPYSPARPYVWTGAALLPAFVAYLRLRAGKHFLSDNLIGYAIGAGAGVLVPHLHKSNSNISLFQNSDPFNNMMVGFVYRF